MLYLALYFIWTMKAKFVKVLVGIFVKKYIKRYSPLKFQYVLWIRVCQMAEKNIKFTFLCLYGTYKHCDNYALIRNTCKWTNLTCLNKY